MWYKKKTVEDKLENRMEEARDSLYTMCWCSKNIINFTYPSPGAHIYFLIYCTIIELEPPLEICSYSCAFLAEVCSLLGRRCTAIQQFLVVVSTSKSSIIYLDSRSMLDPITRLACLCEYAHRCRAYWVEFTQFVNKFQEPFITMIKKALMPVGQT